MLSFFFNFICEELHKSVSQKLRRFIDGSNLASSLCNSPSFLSVVVNALNFSSKEFRCLHADSVVPVDFLHVLGSIEDRFVSAPDAFKPKCWLDW